MSNVAIVLGNAAYERLSNLDCCIADVEAVKALIKATGKYDSINAVVDVDADGMKEAVRKAIANDGPIEEVFFYFSGHGVQRKSEFYFCGTGFDGARPNETGLSNTELHTILRSCNPALVVKVIDACNSGTSLIKNDEMFDKVAKGDFGDFIQIASCLDSQFSLTSDPLSKFTQSFCEATIRKTEGSIFYTDIISSLRDSYIGDDHQTPHFISQGTGRDIFVEDASRLASYRDLFEKEWQEAVDTNDGAEEDEGAEAHRASLIKLMTEAESKFATPDLAKGFIDKLFDSVIDRTKSTEFSDFFEISFEEYSSYRESSTESFIVRCLSNERRPDNFVTAHFGKRKKPRPLWESGLTSAIYGDEFIEFSTLELNCSLERVQLKVTFRPRFKSLDQFCLILTCAPSLNSCHVFERTTKHLRSNWNSFSEEGTKLVENWFDRKWSEDMTWLAVAACGRLLGAAEKQLESVAKRLADGEAEE